MDTVDDDVVAGSGTFFFIEVVFDGKEIESGLGEEGDQKYVPFEQDNGVVFD